MNSIPTASHPAQSTVLVPNGTLITSTPEEGRQLAVRMSRLIVKATQPDAQKREELRGVYANDAMMLIAITQVVATEFATIAAANRYWRQTPQHEPQS